MWRKTRIALAIGVVLIIGLSLLSFFNIASSSRNMFFRQKNIAMDFSQKILGSIGEYMKAGNQGIIQSEFEKYKNQNNILEVSLINQGGEVKRSSETNLLNLKERQRNIEDALEGRDSLMLVMEGPHAGKSLIVTRSIKNREECFSCHDKNAKILGVLKAVFDWTPVEKAIKAGQQKKALSALLGIAVIITAVIVYLKNFVG